MSLALKVPHTRRSPIRLDTPFPTIINCRLHVPPSGCQPQSAANWSYRSKMVNRRPISPARNLKLKSREFGLMSDPTNSDFRRWKWNSIDWNCSGLRESGVRISGFDPATEAERISRKTRRPTLSGDLAHFGSNRCESKSALVETLSIRPEISNSLNSSENFPKERERRELRVVDRRAVNARRAVVPARNELPECY